MAFIFATQFESLRNVSNTRIPYLALNMFGNIWFKSQTQYNFMNGDSDIQRQSPRQCDAGISACNGNNKIKR